MGQEKSDDDLKVFKLTDGFKTKHVKQSDYFTIYLFNQTEGRKNEIYEGFLLKAENQIYNFDVFFEEYESLDKKDNMLVKQRCDLNEHCDRFVSFSQHNIQYVEHNTNAKISAAKISFVTSFVSLLASTFIMIDPGPNENKLFTNKDGSYDSDKKVLTATSGLGFSLLSFGLGMKLMTPHKYHFNYRRTGQHVWRIEE